MKISYRKLISLKKRMEAACRGKMNVHFLHIRKTGGTAIKSALEHAQSTPNAVIYTHPHRVCLADIPRRHKVMFALRDPVDRYVSGFMSRFRKGEPANLVSWTAEEAVAFARFKTPDDLARALDPGASDHEAAVEAMSAIPHLASKQCDWLGDERLFNARCDDIIWIGKQESLTSDFAALKGFLELPSGVILPSGTREAHRAPTNSSAKTELSEEAHCHVTNWYSDDYALIEWCVRWREANKGPVRLST